MIFKKLKNNLKVLLIKIVETFNFFNYNLKNKKEINYEKEFKKIAIILTKPLGIGDLIMMTPFIKSFKKNFPNSKIDLITDKDIFDEVDYIDKIYIVKGNIFELKKEFKLLSKNNYDLGIVMCRGINQVSYINSLKSKYKLGYLGGYIILSNFKLKVNNLKFEKEEHFSNMGLKIAQSLGLKLDKTLIKPNYSKIIQQKVEDIFNNLNLTQEKPIIGLNTNVLWESRRWDENNYIELIKNLHNKFNFILLGGPGRDVQLNKFIEDKLNEENIKIYNLSGKLSLKQSIFAMSKIDLLLTSDSGPMHFGLMMKTPTLGLFGPVNPKFRLPFNYEKMKIYSSLWYCDYKTCKFYDYESEYLDKEMNGLKAIKVVDVEKKILKFFKEGGFY